jgi:hypothetical protein
MNAMANIDIKRLIALLEDEESSLADTDEEELPWSTDPAPSNVNDINDIDWTNTCDTRLMSQTYKTNSCQELNNAIVRFQQLYDVFFNPQGYRCKYQCQQSLDSLIRQQVSALTDTDRQVLVHTYNIMLKMAGTKLSTSEVTSFDYFILLLYTYNSGGYCFKISLQRALAKALNKIQVQRLVMVYA